jgi:hypothetical protein
MKMDLREIWHEKVERGELIKEEPDRGILLKQ